MERKSLALCFFLLFVLVSQEMMMTPAEAKICSAPSGRFKGPCFSSQTCRNICRTLEGLLNGHCTGLACYCSRNC